MKRFSGFDLLHKRPTVTTQKHTMDFGLLFAVLAVVLFGLLMVYDVSSLQAQQDFGDKYYYFRQQIIWIGLGLVSLFFFSFFNYTLFKKIATPIFLGSVLLLLLVNVPDFGIQAGGAHRWLKLGPITIQPAEIIKLASIIFFAQLLQKKRVTLLFLGLTGLVTLVVGVLQKDLGTTIVFATISAGLYYISGSPLITFLSLIPVAIIGFLIMISTSSYRRERILAFLNPFADPQGYTYHISQILIALGSGGLLGRGLGQSRQKFDFIPEVSTDSIFSIIGEELGFIGSTILIITLGFIIYKAFQIAARCEDDSGKLLASGIGLWLGIQTAINLAAMVSLIPLTGVPLPLISYGGSALLANLAAIGILLNISKHTRV